MSCNLLKKIGLSLYLLNKIIICPHLILSGANPYRFLTFKENKTFGVKTPEFLGGHNADLFDCAWGFNKPRLIQQWWKVFLNSQRAHSSFETERINTNACNSNPYNACMLRCTMYDIVISRKPPIFVYPHEDAQLWGTL